MEFKDRLKALRKEKGISQQALASSIFVSRSAVAKWENGLGIPGRASYEALLAYFEVTEERFPLNEEIEQLSVERNRRARLIKGVAFWICFAILSLFPFWLVFAVTHGYGFTPEAAAGEYWADEAYIDTPEYRFYYDTYVDEDGEALPMIYGFCAVKKLPLGYQRLNIAEFKRIASTRDRKDEKLYSFPGKTSYYSFFVQTMVAYPNEGLRLQIIDELCIHGKSYPMLYNCYLETDFEIREFYLKDALYTVS